MVHIFHLHIDLCAKTKNCSWRTKNKLNESLALSTLLYSSPIWALRYIDSLETVHQSFYKRLLNLNKSTPQHIIRLEARSTHVSYLIIKMTLNWLIKILEMDNIRYPKLCYLNLLNLHNNKQSNKKFNWVSQVQDLLENYSTFDPLIFSDPIKIKMDISQITNTVIDKIKLRDRQLLSKCNYSPIYSKLEPLKDEANYYLHYNAPFPFIKTASQLRTSGTYTIKITTNNITHIINPKENCTICNQNSPEDLFHILISCPMYSAIRKFYLPHYSKSDHNNYFYILNPQNAKQVKSLYCYIQEAMKIRSFIIND